MADIPPEIYARVFELTQQLLTASESGDQATYACRYHELSTYAAELDARGKSHPFVTEALADFTDDPAMAVHLYRAAIDQSKNVPAEPTHTKHLALANRLIDLGQIHEAQQHLATGMEQARRVDDSDSVEEAARIARRLVA